MHHGFFFDINFDKCPKIAIVFVVGSFPGGKDAGNPIQ
jgi:hypothetical protein